MSVKGKRLEPSLLESTAEISPAVDGGVLQPRNESKIDIDRLSWDPKKANTLTLALSKENQSRAPPAIRKKSALHIGKPSVPRVASIASRLVATPDGRYDSIVTY